MWVCRAGTDSHLWFKFKLTCQKGLFLIHTLSVWCTAFISNSASLLWFKLQSLFDLKRDCLLYRERLGWHSRVGQHWLSRVGRQICVLEDGHFSREQLSEVYFGRISSCICPWFIRISLVLGKQFGGIVRNFIETKKWLNCVASSPSSSNFDQFLIVGQHPQTDHFPWFVEEAEMRDGVLRRGPHSLLDPRKRCLFLR